jgi:hypothetical protein
MKKCLSLLLCIFCISCANLDAQMASLKKSLNGDAPQDSSSSSSTKPIDSNNQTPQKKSTTAQNTVTPPVASKQSNIAPTSIQASNASRASVPDITSKMKQDMEDAKSPKQKEWEESRKQYKDLLSQADSAYKCSGMYIMPVTIVVLKNSVKFIDMSDKDVSNTYSDIQVKSNMVYFTLVDSKIKNMKFKYVLDTSNNKLIQLVESANTQKANENDCKKIK